MAPYQQYANRVIDMTQRDGFSATEDYINSLPLTPQQRDALWLLAWAYATRAEQRVVASLAAAVW